MDDSENCILWRTISEWWSSYCKMLDEKRQWTVLGSGDGNRKEWKAYKNISEIELMVPNDSWNNSI